MPRRWLGNLVYVATGQALDSEMAQRIAKHREDRAHAGALLKRRWDFPTQSGARADRPGVVLVDCLTLWLSNLMLGDHDVVLATQGLLDALATTSSAVFLVSNEVGLGIVPDNALARRFRDEAGRLNQRVAAAADEVLFVAAGLAMRLK